MKVEVGAYSRLWSISFSEKSPTLSAHGGAVYHDGRSPLNRGRQVTQAGPNRCFLRSKWEQFWKENFLIHSFAKMAGWRYEQTILADWMREQVILRAWLLKLGTIEKMKDRVEETKGVSLGSALIWLPRNIIGKKWAKAGLLLTHWEIQEKGPWRQDQEVSLGQVATHSPSCSPGCKSLEDP